MSEEKKFKRGWKFQEEKKRLGAGQVQADFVRPFQSVQPKLAEWQRRWTGKLIDFGAFQESEYVIDQTVSNGCTSYGGARAVEFLLRNLKILGENTIPFRVSSPNIYANMVRKVQNATDDSGGTINEAFESLSKFGVVPARLVEQYFPKLFHDGVYIDGSARDWYLKSSFDYEKQVYQKFEPVSTHLQVTVTPIYIKREVEDFLKAGCPVVFGTTKDIVFDSRKREFQFPKDTDYGHCMCLHGWNPSDSSTFNWNSWKDGQGKVTQAGLDALVSDRWFCAFGVSDIERKVFE